MKNLQLTEVFNYFWIDHQRKEHLSKIAFDQSRHTLDVEYYRSPGYDNEWWAYSEIVDYIAKSAPTIENKVQLLFEVFEIFPTYAHSMMEIYYLVALGQIQKTHQDFQSYFWKKLISYFISKNEAYRWASVYMLGIELFENNETMDYTWNSFIEFGDNTYEEYEVLLMNSWYVKMSLKVKLYSDLVQDKKYHVLILKSIAKSEWCCDFRTSIRQAVIREALPILNQLLYLDENTLDEGMKRWYKSIKLKVQWHNLMRESK